MEEEKGNIRFGHVMERNVKNGITKITKEFLFRHNKRREVERRNAEQCACRGRKPAGNSDLCTSGQASVVALRSVPAGRAGLRP